MGFYTDMITYDGVDERGQIVVSVFHMQSALDDRSLRDFSHDNDFRVAINDKIPEITLYDGKRQSRYVFHLCTGSRWGLDEEHYMGREIERFLA